jgi:hypothetical protein
MSGGHATGEKIAPRGANTNDYKEAIKGILRRSDKDAPRAARLKQENAETTRQMSRR